MVVEFEMGISGIGKKDVIYDTLSKKASLNRENPGCRDEMEKHM